MRVLLAAAFITYMSSAPEDVRHSCLKDWMQYLQLSDFDLRHFLSTESEQLIWKSEGLPSDDLSMENALVILQVLSFIFLTHVVGFSDRTSQSDRSSAMCSVSSEPTRR